MSSCRVCTGRSLQCCCATVAEQAVWVTLAALSQSKPDSVGRPRFTTCLTAHRAMGSGFVRSLCIADRSHFRPVVACLLCVVSPTVLDQQPVLLSIMHCLPACYGKSSEGKSLKGSNTTLLAQHAQHTAHFTLADELRVGLPVWCRLGILEFGMLRKV